MKLLLTILLLLQAQILCSQTINNMSLLGSKSEYTSGGTPAGWHYASVWGYAANGREYAIIGHYAGTTVYDITDPANIINKGMIPGPGSFYNYREMKTYSHYLYIVAEGANSGLQIVDLQYLPDSIHFVKKYTYAGYGNTHSISQDGPYLYLSGGNNAPAGGLTILDITDPENPVKRGQWTTRYVHDCFIRNDTVFAACISSNPPNMTVLDARNKDSIKFITSFTYPGAVTHNSWATNDGKFLVTTDEGGSNHAKMWNIADIFNPVQIADINPYELSMVHNAYIKGDSLYLAHYRAGVIVYNIVNRASPVEVGHYDTFPGTGLAFQGCWNVYPFLPSGRIIASDIATGLYVLKLGSSTGIDPNTGIPAEYSLKQNYPNPFNPETKIEYSVPSKQLVTLKVYDNLGREVKTLINETKERGNYSVNFYAGELSNGVYFYKIKAGEFTETRKMLLIK